jgi:hypothetical protein
MGKLLIGTFSPIIRHGSKIYSPHMGSRGRSDAARPLSNGVIVARPVWTIMPSLFRFLLVVGILAAAVYAAMFGLAHFVQPKPREITVTVPQDRLLKPPR